MCERTIAKYEEELCPTKEEKERQHQLLDAVFKKHQVVLHRTDVQQHPHIKEEEEDPQPPHIKEEEEEVWVSQEGECLLGQEEADVSKFPLTVVSVKTEEHEDEAAESSQLHHSPNLNEEHLPHEQGKEPQSPHIHEEDEVPLSQHIKEGGEEPQHPHIKEEEEEHSISQEGEHLEGLLEFPVTGVPVKSEDDEVKGRTSIHPFPTAYSLFGVSGGTGAYLSYNRAEGGVHPGQVATSPQGQRSYLISSKKVLLSVN
ncbi:involucrin-like isoform X2 [Nerophis ophidion]|uniref:involucrin-like isoform X2 n=1 Tax=Nerophis ophidion TaxID=159077 RepID=UPI002AE02DC4|nr:involucrin-like isoform X2 [Nerophis ophidion]